MDSWLHICNCLLAVLWLFVCYIFSSQCRGLVFGMRGSRGGDSGSGPFLKNHKNIGFRSNTVPDPLKIYKATKPAFNVGPS